MYIDSIQLVNDRAIEIMKELHEKNIVMKFKSKDEAHAWLMKSAIITLIGLN